VDECLSCNATQGFVDDPDDGTKCHFCGPGKFADKSESLCGICPRGRFSVGGVNDCIDCSEGKVTGGDGATSCAFCSPGEVPVNGVCQACLVSTAAAYEALNCVTCDGPGEYADEEGLSNCKIALPGTRPKADFSGLENCNKGTYSSEGVVCLECDGDCEFTDQVGATYCKEAPPGRFSAVDRRGTLPCAANTYSEGGSDICLPCEDGGHPLAGAVSCHQCGPGEFFNATNSTCIDCPLGTYSSTGAKNIGDCFQCDESKNEFSEGGARAAYCSVVEAGYELNEEKTEQIMCPNATFSNGDGCKPCDGPGQFSLAGSSYCR